MAAADETTPESVRDSASDTESAAASPEERTDSVKRRKKKKKKGKMKRRRAAASRLDRHGRERPAFVLDFPEHPELSQLVAAFEAGNYHRVRQGAERLLARSDSLQPEVRDAASELIRRTQPDPLVKYLLVASVTLLVFLTLHAYLGH
jgi:hypothetical protein